MDSLTEIFEIADFTCVTDWERLTADIESLVHEWQLTNSQTFRPLEKCILNSVSWETHEEHLKYNGIDFTVTHYRASVPVESPQKASSNKANSKIFEHFPNCLKDLVDGGQDFALCNADVHSIVKYYGIREFVVLWPTTKIKELMDENSQSLLLSSLILATNNTQCDVPMFVQIGERHRQIFGGVCQNSDVRTHFEMIHLKNRPAKCNHLSGLLDLFKEKVATPLNPAPPVKVSVRITYKLQEAFDQQWMQPPEDFHAENVEELRSLLRKSNFSQLPFGALQDPLQDLILSAAWHGLNEDMIIENDVYSDLDPVSAPHWAASIGFAQNFRCLMSEYLKEYMKLTGRHRTIENILGSSIGNVADLSLPLDRLAKRTSPNLSSLTSMVGKASSSSANDKLPLKEDVLNNLLTYLFPDSSELVENKERRLSSTSTDDVDAFSGVSTKRLSRLPQVGGAVKISSRRSTSIDHKHAHVCDSFDLDLESTLAQSKIAPKGSVTSRLSLVLCHLSNSLQNEVAFCQLWREFLLELRFRFENGIRIPGLENVTPNLNSCFLNQKIQMLNCCIERKILREQRKATGSEDASNENEEFFDCFDDENDLGSKASDAKPDGRLKALDNRTCLLKKPDQLLYIPVTQDPAPLTEDTIDERTHSLMQLGTSEEAAAYRAKIQCSSLVSDMEAFKAANPSCCFEDFLVWYSPKDVTITVNEEDGSTTAVLSNRMSASDNLWNDAWINCKAVPVIRQRRLFDDTKEAEKILHWLEGLKVSEIVRLTLPPLFALALTQLWDEAKPVRNLLEEKLKEISQRFPVVVKSAQFIEFDDLCKLFEWVEATVSEYRTLKNRFSFVSKEIKDASAAELHEFILNLMTQPEVKLIGGSRDYIGQVLMKLFRNDTRVSSTAEGTTERGMFPPWLTKEYVFRQVVPRPLSSSRDCIQRLYVFVKESEFRAAAAYTEDIMYFCS